MSRGTASKLFVLTALLFLTTTLVAATGSLEIVVRNESSTAIEDAQITINDGAFEKVATTGDEGSALFDGLDAATYRVTIEHEQYFTRELSINVEDNTKTSKTVILEEKDLYGDVLIHAETKTGDDIPDVEVRLVGEDNDYEKILRTSSGGYVRFEDVPVGDYTAYLQHPSFTPYQLSVNVYDGKTSDYEVTMRTDKLKGQGLQVSNVVLPSLLRRGATFQARVSVTNHMNETANQVQVSGSVFDQQVQTGRFSIPEDETVTRTLEFTVPKDASSPATVRVTASDYQNSDTVSIDVPISQYRVSMRLGSDTTSVGNAVYVSGRVTDRSGGAANVAANLYLNEQLVTGITTDATGRYSAYVRPESTGIYKVSLRSSSFHVTKNLRVVPALQITRLDMPAEVNQTANATACAQVEVTGTQFVTGKLVFNGRVTAQKTVNLSAGSICLPVPTQAPGQFDVTFVTKTREERDTESASITVLPKEGVKNPGITVQANDSVSLDQYTNVTLPVEVYNPTNTSHNITIRLGGLAEGMMPGNGTRLSIGSNSTATVNLTVAGGDSGSFIASVDVVYRNETVLSHPLTVNVKGAVEARFEELLAQARTKATQLFDKMMDNKRYVVAALLILLLLVAFYRRSGSGTPSSLEPKNE
ncbi:MAG: carboxypeptidase-like regulatory domain-containing protein [Candidatus Nanohaloarchaea archaeon]|nr:carboxypeptidase-like regulatory domain-containing protein [Candidatus Nanohaloarchaea archaeon]